MNTLLYITIGSIVIGVIVICIDKFGKSGKKNLWIVALQFVIAIVAIGSSIKTDSANNLDKQKLKHEKDSLVNKNRTDSALLTKRWMFDTARIKQIIESTGKISDKVNQNLKQVNKTLKASSILLSKVRNIDTSTQTTKRLEESKFFPISPMDYEITYTYSIRRIDFNRLCPYFGITYFEKIKNNFPSTTEYIPWDIDSSAISFADSISQDFLLYSNIQIFFQEDSNNLKKQYQFSHPETVFGLTPAEGFHDIKSIKSCRIVYNSKNVTVTIKKHFVNVYKGTLYRSDILGIKEIKGWYFTCKVKKEDVDSITTSELLIFTGQNKTQQLGFLFKIYNNSNTFIYSRILTSECFESHEQKLKTITR